MPLHQLWSRRHSTKFNGASYPVQKGAAAVFSAQGKARDAVADRNVRVLVVGNPARVAGWMSAAGEKLDLGPPDDGGRWPEGATAACPRTGMVCRRSHASRARSAPAITSSRV